MLEWMLLYLSWTFAAFVVFDLVAQRPIVGVGDLTFAVGTRLGYLYVTRGKKDPT